MEILALRLVLPPAIVVLASLGQRHLGDRLAGLLIGLPLTSGTYLALILPSHGPAAVSGAACGMLAGQVAVTVTALAYAWLAPRTGTAAALLVTLAVWAATVMALRPVGGVVSAALFVLLATFALLRWPTAPPTTPPMDPTSRPAVGMGELAQRVVLTTGLVFTLTAGTTRLGPQFAGLLAAAPLVVLILTPATHRGRGADAVRALLHGVVRGPWVRPPSRSWSPTRSGPSAGWRCWWDPARACPLRPSSRAWARGCATGTQMSQAP